MMVLFGWASPALATSLEGADDVRWGYLENGSGYLIIESHAAPMIGGTAVIHGGAGLEDWSTQGASHFLEHLLFNGTDTRTQEEIYDTMDLLGAYNNATTRSTHVVFMILAAKNNFWPAFDVQRDMIFNSTLPPEKLEKERGIILEELAKDRASSDFDLERLFQLDTYGAQGYGLPTLGSEVSIESISRDDIERFYQTYYVPNNITWVLIGDVDAETAIDSLAATVGRVPARPLAAPQAVSGLVDRSAPRIRLHHHEVDNPLVQWVWEGPDPSGADFEALRARFELQVSPEDGPLYQALSEAWGELASYQVWLEELPGRSVITLRVGFTHQDAAQRALDEFDQVAGSALSTPPSDEALQAWKRSEETSEIYLREKPHYYGIFRGERIAARGLASMAAQLRVLRQLSALDVADAHLPLGDPAARITVVLPPAAAETPSDADTSVSFDSWTLDNGAEVAAFSSPESEVLAVHVFIKDRSAREPEGKAGMAELLHSMLGTATKSQDESELRLSLQSIGAQLKTSDNSFIPYDDFYSTPGFSYVRFQCLDRDAESAFELLRDIVAEPVLDESAFTRAKSGLQAQVEKDEGSARSVARDMVSEAVDGTTARSSVFGTPESVESIGFEELQEFAGRYLDPSEFLLVVASSRSLDDLQALTKSTFGGIDRPSAPLPRSEPEGASDLGKVGRLRAKAGDAMSNVEWVPATVAARFGVETREVGAEQSYVSLVRGFHAPDSARAVLTVANGILSDRLAFQLREREGLAYSIGSSLRHAGEGEWLWTASAGTRADNISRLSEGFAESVEALLAEPPTDTEVRKTAASLYGRGLMRRATRLNLCYYAGLAILNDRDPLKLEERELALEEVTADAVTSAVRTYWKESPGLLVIAR